MSQFVETNCRKDVAAGAIASYLRVKTPGAVAVAGALEFSFGTCEKDVFAAGVMTVRLKTAGGTRKMVANGAITAGSMVYGAAGGKISAVVNTNIEGLALEAAAADGDVIEVMTIDQAVFNPVTPYAANGAIAITNGTAMITKTGSLAAMTLAAPTAAQEGTILRIISQTAFAHTVTATGLIDDGATGGSKTTLTFAAFAGASVELVASNLKWAVLGRNNVTPS